MHIVSKLQAQKATASAAAERKTQSERKKVAGSQSANVFLSECVCGRVMCRCVFVCCKLIPSQFPFAGNTVPFFLLPSSNSFFFGAPWGRSLFVPFVFPVWKLEGAACRRSPFGFDFLFFFWCSIQICTRALAACYALHWSVYITRWSQFAYWNCPNCRWGRWERGLRSVLSHLKAWGISGA